jgi:hypothetical protein
VPDAIGDEMTQDQSYASFKKLYSSTLSDEIGLLFYASFAGADGVAGGGSESPVK